MVRINLISPKSLTDQHLLAENVEILMLVGYVRKHPSLNEIPLDYCLGKGHIKFFKNKLKYLKLRHELIKKEMKKRGFKTTKSLLLSGFKKKYLNDWNPSSKDVKIIKERISLKIKNKPNYYRYYKKRQSEEFLLSLMENT